MKESSVIRQDGNAMHSFLTSDGCAIAYRRFPAIPGAPRLSLLHSLALDSSMWDDVVTHLSGQVEILTYDCRGHGRSGRPKTPYIPGLFARDLAELLDHVGWATAAIAGCSMGGCVAQAFAIHYPQRVEALGLIDTTAWYGREAPVKWRERAATAHSKGLAGMLDFQTTRWFTDGFRDAHPEIVKAVARVFLGNDLDCFAATCLMLGDVDLRSGLPLLRMPVSVIVGEEDYATPISAAQQIHQSIAGSTLTILRPGRHLTPIECAEQIAEQLLMLLQRGRRVDSPDED